MDHEIPQNNNNRKGVVVILLLMISMLACVVFYINKPVSMLKKSELEILSIDSEPSKITTIGTMKPRKSIKLSSEIGGRVKYFININQSYVKKGDVILVVHSKANNGLIVYPNSS